MYKNRVEGKREPYAHSLRMKAHYLEGAIEPGMIQDVI